MFGVGLLLRADQNFGIRAPLDSKIGGNRLEKTNHDEPLAIPIDTKISHSDALSLLPCMLLIVHEMRCMQMYGVCADTLYSVNSRARPDRTSCGREGCCLQAACNLVLKHMESRCTTHSGVSFRLQPFPNPGSIPPRSHIARSTVKQRHVAPPAGSRAETSCWSSGTEAPECD